MLDDLFMLGQALCLLGLGWGAWLAVTASELAVALRELKSRPQLRSRDKRRLTAAEDPHVSSLGYWP